MNFNPKENTLNLEQYVPNALRTEKKYPLPIARLVHAALGIDTETGELNTIIKRVAIYGKDMDTADVKGVTLRMHAGEEIGDAVWYVAIMIDVLDIHPNEVAAFPATYLVPLDDLAMQLGTASGRICDLVGYMNRSGFNKPSQGDRVQLINFTAALLRVLNAACFALGLDMSVLLDANIAKLRERFPDAYSDEAAEARADKGGLDARSS